ncbi:serine proteinase stubble-like isoform X2 [Armigeres subalbatus]|uniref:serine proteinase stubble-like isoform X2 n=1 Tax=Armigeres subalbatus TaxID=124917 RepID=UPI002ED5C515
MFRVDGFRSYFILVWSLQAWDIQTIIGDGFLDDVRIIFINYKAENNISLSVYRIAFELGITTRLGNVDPFTRRWPDAKRLPKVVATDEIFRYLGDYYCRNDLCLPIECEGLNLFIKSRELMTDMLAPESSRPVTSVPRICTETEIDSIRLSENTYTDGADNSPDCICVPNNLCRTAITGERARDSLCGVEQICCRKHQIISQHHSHVSTVPPRPVEPVTPIALHAAVPAIDLPVVPEAPNQSLLLEISALLQELNSHEHPLEPDAEFIFQTTPPVQISTPGLPSTTTPYKPIVFSDSRPYSEKSETTSSSIRTPSVHATSTAAPPRPAKAKKCGQRRLAIASRIHFQESDESIEDPLEGTANFGEFPWSVYLEERIGNGSFLYKCGGALVTSNAVVTAGHCIANARDQPERFQIVAGDWDRRHSQERLPSQRRVVSRIFLHPDYYSGSLYNDIAVLILDVPLDESFSNVGNVCLPTQASDFKDGNCVLTSWGASPSSPAQEESILRFVSMPLIEGSSCEERLRSNSTLGRRFRMHKSFLCAGGKAGLDSCKGSGGSPLVCERNGSHVLAGILSWGVSCGEGVPVVFTNVAFQAEWVRRKIDNLDDNIVYFV